jgi:hypothetical protein
MRSTHHKKTSDAMATCDGDMKHAVCTPNSNLLTNRPNTLDSVLWFSLWDKTQNLHTFGLFWWQFWTHDLWLLWPWSALGIGSKYSSRTWIWSHLVERPCCCCVSTSFCFILFPQSSRPSSPAGISHIHLLTAEHAKHFIRYKCQGIQLSSGYKEHKT